MYLCVVENVARGARPWEGVVPNVTVPEAASAVSVLLDGNGCDDEVDGGVRDNEDASRVDDNVLEEGAEEETVVREEDAAGGFALPARAATPVPGFELCKNMLVCCLAVSLARDRSSPNWI